MLTLEVSFHNAVVECNHLSFLILGLNFTFSNCNLYCNLFVAGLAYTNLQFGSGIGSIVLDDVQCVSSDNQLLECSSRPILSHNCAHSDDAGVGCEGTYFVIYSTY